MEYRRGDTVYIISFLLEPIERLFWSGGAVAKVSSLANIGLSAASATTVVSATIKTVLNTSQTFEEPSRPQ